ncbi:MAG TPA: sigma-70 family RNA polymerase sigma factor [Kaistia sp.]|nr:sigma-70 family RNA polymerase sigma factor [Kaistia sp.]
MSPKAALRREARPSPLASSGDALRVVAGLAARQNRLAWTTDRGDGVERRPSLGSVSDADDADAALTLRLKAGDERALEALMLRHGGRLRLIARRILARGDEAEDIVQDVFLAVWRRANRLDAERGPIGAYLTRAVVNRAIDRARRARFLQFIGLDTAPEGADETPGPEVTALARSEVSAVMRDLQALPPRQRAAILLASSDEHSTASIADVMNLSVGATEQLLVRARRTLRLHAMARQQIERAGEL